MSLKKLNKKFVNLASAVAFAECGEWDTACEFLGDVDSAVRSKNRKFIVLFDETITEPSFFRYVEQLSDRLTCDIVFLQTLRNNSRLQKASVSIGQAKETFSKYSQAIVEKVKGSGVDCYYLVSAIGAKDSLQKLYHKIGHVEFAIVPETICSDDWANLGLPLFVYRN